MSIACSWKFLAPYNQLPTKVNVLLIYRNNRIDKRTSVRAHGTRQSVLTARRENVQIVLYDSQITA